ncbi:hypothetical protein KEM52_005029 [Ascosphaera acerosa]|nr:hypothetical protein KEM52_005029 [Ascosphaera acerosa]
MPLTLRSFSPPSRPQSTVTSSRNISSPVCVSPDLVTIPLSEGLPYWCLSTALQEELAQLYFKYVHGTHHSLFQRGSVIEALRVGRLPPVILYGIMALGARFSDNPLFNNENRWNRGALFADRACRLLDLTDISIVTIQGALLIGTWCYAECKPQAEALYNTIANRLASIIDLPHRPADSEMEKQENLRVYWTLYMHDTWGSPALQLPKQFSLDESVPLPADEIFFLSLTRTTPPIQGPLPSGIWGEIPKLTKLLSKIQAMHKAFVAGSLDSASLNMQVDSIFRKMQRWSDLLPPNLRETRPNMERHAALSLGPEFVSLHLAYHYYHEILFYQFLAEGVKTQDEPTSPQALQARYYAEQCTKHAVAFCDLLYTCYEIPGCEVLYVMIGHMLVVTSTVYIHLLLFSRDEARITLARERLARNFEILMTLQRYWKALELSLARLKKFHNACQSSIEGTFRMDKWMLRFILEYSLDMSEKYASTPTPNITSMAYGLSPPHLQPPHQHQGQGQEHQPYLYPHYNLNALADGPVGGHDLPPTSGSPDLDLQNWYEQTFR